MNGMNEEMLRDMKPQTRQILKALRAGAVVTSLYAWSEFGISRLSARIWELRHEYGFPVKAMRIKVKTRETGERFAIVTGYYMEDMA